MSDVDENAVFNTARRIGDAAERTRYLEAACGGDDLALARIRELLSAHEKGGSFLEGAAFAGPAPLLESAGATIGPYKLLEQIGEGGFGVVFMAEQTAPVRRRVALKVLKPGMDTRQVIARFEAERQALALMDHPNIARVLDAGTTGTGRPFFVMELVKGIPITEYCDAHRLTPRELLELFVTVCHAIQHAHQKGIVHRDLKPSNVLVALHDDRPVAKVIDFGIAKATSGTLTEKTVFTAFAQMIGTPLYMSPEQAASALDVDTRSDVYSLGVLLYELLTGTTPFDKARLKEAAFDEVRRIIREEEPARPSTRLSTSDGLPTLAANRRTEPAKLTKLVRGELDWIVMKALEKDRARRYETANGLAMDVQRHLADEAVLACPPSAVYRLRKLAGRHKGALAAVALLSAALLVVAGSIGWMAREGAARHGRNAEAVASLVHQCEQALREDAADRAALALEAAERRAADGGASEFEGRLADCRADLKLLRELDAIDTLSWTWTNEGPPSAGVLAARWKAAMAEHGTAPIEGGTEEAARRVNASPVRDRALTALDRWLAAEPSAAVRAVLRVVDPDPYRDAVRDAFAARNVPALIDLAGRQEALMQPARFASVLADVDGVPLERRRAVMESALRSRPGDLVLLMGMSNSYARQVDGRSDATGEAQAANERLRWLQAAVAAHPTNVAALINLGRVLAERADLDGGIACFEGAIRVDPTFAKAHYNLGNALRLKGEPDKAIASFREAIRQKPDYVSAHFNLGFMLAQGGDPDGAMACYREATRLDPNCAPAYGNLGSLLFERGDLAGALVQFEAAARIAPTANNHYAVANTLWEKGDWALAAAAYRRVLERKPDHAEALCNLGGCLVRLGRFTEALEPLRKGDELGRQQPGWSHPSEQWVKDAESLAALDLRLAPVLSGGAAPPAELLDLAQQCQRRMRRYADATLLYARAFAAEPSRARELGSHRYNAACSAALAGCGREVASADRARLRAMALDWLQAELAAYGENAAVEQLKHWLVDPDLSGVRDAPELAQLPDDERERWTRLWNDVRDRVATAAKN